MKFFEKLVYTYGGGNFLKKLQDFFNEPKDGETYGRKNGTWSKIEGGGGGDSQHVVIEVNNLLSLSAAEQESIRYALMDHYAGLGEVSIYSAAQNMICLVVGYNASSNEFSVVMGGEIKILYYT